MIKHLFATSALALILSGSALAQTATPEGGDDGLGGPIFMEDGAALESMEGFFEADENLVLATSLIGETVYTGASDEAETVGEIRDIVMGQNGVAEAVVVGVGGFLGIGEKDVAVDFERISRTADNEGDVWLVIDANAEQLEAAPTFERATVDASEQAAAIEAEETIAAAEGEPVEGVAPVTEETAQAPAAAPSATDGIEADEQMLPIEELTLGADELMDLDVYGPDNTEIGEISDVLVSGEGTVDGFVIDVGGFLGLGAKPVAIGLDNLQVVVDEGQEAESIHTSFTKEQLEAHAEYSEEAYTAGDDSLILRAAE